MSGNHYNWKIFNAAVVVSGVSLFTKIFSACKDLIIAALFGTGVAVDSFILAALIPLMSVQVLAVPFAAALVPEVTRLRVAGQEFAARKLFETYLGRAVFLLIPLGLFLYLFSDFFAGILSAGNPQGIGLTSSCMRILAPLIIIAGVAQIFVMILNAFERFAIPAFSQILSPLGIILGVYLSPSNGAVAIAWGALAGNFAQLIMLIGYYLWSKKGNEAQSSKSIEIKKISDLWSSWLALFASTLMMSSAEIVDQAMAAQLGAGEVATLNYGTKVVGVFISVVAGALGSAAFPYISQMIERKEEAHLAQTLKTYVRLIILCSVVVVLLVVSSSESIIWLLFERGAFLPSDTERVALVQSLSIIQLPFYLINTLYMRVIMGHKLMGRLAQITVISITLNIALNFVFSSFLGVAGIALSTSCVYVWSALALFWSSKQQKLFGN